VAADYYTVLQVHPDAEFEVIEAAYRQLMKKHHPDMAGDDPQRIAVHLSRAKAINEAFSVLRDPEKRRRYDLDRLIGNTVRPAPSSPPHASPSAHGSSQAHAASSAQGSWQAHAASSAQGSWQANAAASAQGSSPPHASASASGSSYANPAASRGSSAPDGASAARGTSPPSSGAPEAASFEPPLPWFLAPIALLSAAYYLLPGPYEWEGGRGRELLSVLLLPPTGLAGFALASGRLTPLIGHSLSANVMAWAILALCVVVSMWGSVLRVVAAAVPSAALMSGYMTPLLQESHLPVWLAWCLLSSVSLLFAARLFVFGVLPTLGLIWLLARPG
jgi:hypothetical protein